MSEQSQPQVAVPVVLPTDDQLPASKGDVRTAKDDIRREMRLTVGLCLLGGQTVAALVGSYLAAPGPTQAALEAVVSSIPLV